MKFTNSPYLYLSLSLTIVLLAFGLLPQLTSSAVTLRPAPPVEPALVQPTITHNLAELATATPDYGNDEPRKVVDQMPMFPGCEDKGAYPKRKKCADRAMLEYIYATIRYPEEAREGGVQGMAVVSFVVERDGRVSNAKVVRDPGAGTGAEALRVVRNMQQDDIYWIPGRHEGRPVRVQFNLPVKFKLE